MTNRILEIAETGAIVRYSNRLIEVAFKDREIVSVPAEEIGVLLLSNPAISISQAAISGIIEQGGLLIVCNRNYLPSGMFLPIGSHSSAARNYEMQVKASEPIKKQVWQSIIMKKIRFQGDLLFRLYQTDYGLKSFEMQVNAGDAKNIEGVAARIYWARLFGEEFRRNRDAPDQNRYLNYGYTVLRACTARAICSAGLHPSFGIHHHNQYDAFRLADDLMEPFRPLIDRKVKEIVESEGAFSEMDKERKKKLLTILTESVLYKKEHISVFEALTRCCVSLLEVFEKERKKIILPDELFIRN